MKFETFNRVDEKINKKKKLTKNFENGLNIRSNSWVYNNLELLCGLYFILNEFLIPFHVYDCHFNMRVTSYC